jgi:hypothetical protein
MADLIICVQTHYWTFINLLVVLVSFLVYVLWILVYDQILNIETNAGHMLLTNPYFYVQAVLVVGVVFMSYLFGVVVIKEWDTDYGGKVATFFNESINDF